MRIVSQVPSATELRCALGVCGDVVVGNECDDPPHVPAPPTDARSIPAVFR